MRCMKRRGRSIYCITRPGTNALRRGNLLERYFRDVHAAMMHAGGLTANFEQGGRVSLGRPAGAPGW